jgi:recombination associated protein RdgC
MFKNLIICNFSGDCSSLEQALDAVRFVPCGLTQERSFGFVPPRGDEHAALVESQSHHRIAAIMFETRSVPGQEVKRRVDELAAAVEQNTGRRPGKKLLRELKERAHQELLPKAFVKRLRVLIWFDTKNKILALDTGSTRVADEVRTALVKAVDGLQLTAITTNLSPTTAMHWWLTKHTPHEFSIDRECDLKSSDAMKSIVRYKRCPLDTDEVRDRLRAGMYPTKLAMTWRSRLSFVLTDAMHIKKIELLDLVFESRANLPSASDAFDGDMAIATGELAPFIKALIAQLDPEPY